RDELYGFSGRNRKPQIELAEKFGLTEFAQPAGGCCFLTHEAYSNKLADLWQAKRKRDYELDDIMLLKVGRHIRPRPHFKMIVSREEGEGNFLQGYRYQYPSIEIVSHRGPLTLIDGELTDAGDLEQAATIAARFSQGGTAEEVVVAFREPNGVVREITVAPMRPDQIDPQWHVGEHRPDIPPAPAAQEA